MITYEVNLKIDNEIFDEYYNWLIKHIHQMLQFEGFMQAEIGKEMTDNSEQSKLTVRYKLQSEESLNNYLNNYANAMRDDGINKFGYKFSVTRRVFLNLCEMQE